MAMTVNQRKAALIEKGVSQAEIARELNVSPTYICNVIKGKGPAQKARELIAAKIGRAVDEVFGAAA
jgi:transcriptional regulator with XRE-family HTH domain